MLNQDSGLDISETVLFHDASFPCQQSVCLSVVNYTISIKWNTYWNKEIENNWPLQPITLRKQITSC